MASHRALPIRRWVPWAVGAGALGLLALRARRASGAGLSAHVGGGAGPSDVRPIDDPAHWPLWHPGASYLARGTGYFPDSSAMEGGFHDRHGRPLGTLQAFLAGQSPYVSVAMDATVFPYGARLQILEIEQKYGRPIPFRVTDTGGAFTHQGTGRIDICTANQPASLDHTINGPLHLVVPHDLRS